MKKNTINIRQRMVKAVGDKAMRSASNEQLLMDFVDLITKEELMNDKITFEDPDAKNGLLVTFAIMMMLNRGIKPADAFRRVCSQKLIDPYGFHASLLSFLDVENFEYDDDEILDICLNNLK